MQMKDHVLRGCQVSCVSGNLGRALAAARRMLWRRKWLIREGLRDPAGSMASQDSWPELLRLPLVGPGLVAKEISSFISVCHLFESRAHVLGGPWAEGRRACAPGPPGRLARVPRNAHSSLLNWLLCPTPRGPQKEMGLCTDGSPTAKT